MPKKKIGLFFDVVLEYLNQILETCTVTLHDLN